jgi:outer membrane beta-barrel protein
MKRITIALAFALLAVFGGTKIATAQEILLEGPLAGQPAVRKLVQYRQLRFSVGPQFGYSILNNYEHNFLLGLRLDFNFVEWLSIGGVIYYSFNAPTKLTKYISESKDIGGDNTTTAPSNFPSYGGATNFEDQVGLLKGMYLGQISLIPLRGKLSLFEKLFVAVDGYIFFGGGAIQMKERQECNSKPLDENSEVLECGNLRSDGTGNIKRVGRVAGTFTAGVGFMGYFNDWFALNLEYRLAPFKWNEGGTDESGKAGKQWSLVKNEETNELYWKADSEGAGDYPDGNISKEDRIWKANQSIALGFIFYFPLKPRIAQ